MSVVILPINCSETAVTAGYTTQQQETTKKYFRILYIFPFNEDFNVSHIERHNGVHILKLADVKWIQCDKCLDHWWSSLKLSFIYCGNMTYWNSRSWTVLTIWLPSGKARWPEDKAVNVILFFINFVLVRYGA